MNLAVASPVKLVTGYVVYYAYPKSSTCQSELSWMESSVLGKCFVKDATNYIYNYGIILPDSTFVLHALTYSDRFCTVLNMNVTTSYPQNICTTGRRTFIKFVYSLVAPVNPVDINGLAKR